MGRKEFLTHCRALLPLRRKENAMKTIVSAVTIFVVFLLSVSVCFAQDYQSITAVKFKDGSIVRGKIIEMNPTTIKILKPDGNIETRRYQDVASFIQGPYSGEQPASRPSVAPPPRPYATYYRAPANYFVFKAGVYSPESDELRHFDSGFNGEIAFGHYFHPNFAMELGAGYFEVEPTYRSHYYYRSYYYYGGSSEKDRIWVVPITLSLKPALQFPPFELYALGGGGLYIINVETSGNLGQTGSFSFSDSGSVFGAHLGAGLNWNITPRVAIGVEGKYIWAEKKFEKTVNNETVQVNADVQGLQTTLNLSFRF